MIVAANGADLFVDIHGDADAPPLLLMHSIGTSSIIWQRVAEQLASRYRVICPDFRGHGRSSGTTGPYDTAAMADDMVALCDALGIGRLHVGGLSLGGLVTLQLAVQHPERVASLILCDTGLSIPPPSMWLDRAATARHGGVAALGDAVFDRWVTPAFAATEEGQRLRKTSADTSGEGYAAAAEAIAGADFSSVAANIVAPAVVIVGSEDVATPPTLAAEMCDALPDARMHIVQGSRHIPSIEYPTQTATLIAAFVDGIETAH